MATARQYKFFLGGKEVYPYTESFCLNRTEQEDQVFCRVEFDGELCFVNDYRQSNYDFDVEDFTYLYDIDQTAERCNDLELLIQQCCPDSETFEDCWEGYVCFDAITFDCDKCIATTTPSPRDKYACLLEAAPEEFNILEIENKQTVCPYIGQLDSLICEEIFPAGTPEEDLLAEGCLVGPGWTLISNGVTIDFYGNLPSLVTSVWVRELFTGATQPPGSWLSDTNGWVREIAVCNPSVTINTQVNGYVTTTTSSLLCLFFDSVFDNGVLLKDVLENCNLCGLEVKSNFFDINPDGSNPGNSAYTCAQTWLQCLVMYQKSDIMTANVSGNATIGLMSCEKLFEIFRKQYNVYWDITEDPVTGVNYLCIEHISYFEQITGQVIDIEDNQCLRGLNKYGYTNQEQPSLELFEYMEATSTNFSTEGIKYPTNCEANVKTVTTKVDCVNNDVEYLIRNSEENDDGFVFLAATESDGKKVLLSQATGDGTAHANGHHSWYNLLRCYFLNDRPQGSGFIDGEPFNFETFKKTKKQDSFTLIDFPCDEVKNLTCNTRWKTKVGTGTADSIKWCSKGCTLELSLRYDPIPCLADPCPDFVPVVIGVNNSEECQPNWDLTVQYSCDEEVAIIWEHDGSTTDTITVTEYGTYCAYARCGDCIKYAYFVVAPDDNGCEVELTIEVSEPILNPCPTWTLTPTITNCDEDIEYQWIGPNGFESISEIITVTEAGGYTLTIKCGCCVVTETINVPPVDACGDVQVFIDAVEITEELECPTLCPVFRLTATVNGCDDPIIQWSNGQIGADLIVYEPDVYSVIVKCGCDCTIIETTEVEFCCLGIEIVECDPCDVDCIEGTGNCDCEGGEVEIPCAIMATLICSDADPCCDPDPCNCEKILTVVPAGMFLPPVFYVWSNGASTQSINISTAGSYSVEVFASNGCSATAGPFVMPECECTGCNCSGIGETIECEMIIQGEECCYQPILLGLGECVVFSDNITWTDSLGNKGDYIGAAICTNNTPISFTRTLVLEDCGLVARTIECEGPCDLLEMLITVEFGGGVLGWGELMYDGAIVADYIIEWCYTDDNGDFEVAFTSGAGANFDANTMFSHPPTSTVLAQAGPLTPKIISWSVADVPVQCVELCIEPVIVEPVTCDSVFDVSYIGPGGITANEFTFIIDPDTQGIQFSFYADDQPDSICITQDGVTEEYGPFDELNTVTLLTNPAGSPEVVISLKNSNPSIQTIWDLEFKKCCTEVMDCADFELRDPVFASVATSGCNYTIYFYQSFTQDNPLCPAATTNLCDLCATTQSNSENGGRFFFSVRPTGTGGALNMPCYDSPDISVNGGLDLSFTFLDPTGAAGLCAYLSDPSWSANPDRYALLTMKEPDCVSDGTQSIFFVFPGHSTISCVGNTVTILPDPNPYSDIPCSCEGVLYGRYEDFLNHLSQPSSLWQAVQGTGRTCRSPFLPIHTETLDVRCADGSTITLSRRYRIVFADPDDPSTWELWELSPTNALLNYIIGAADNPQPIC